MKGSAVYRFPLFLLLLVFGGVCCVRADEEPSIARLYSDICLNSESGDLHGVRIGILDLPDANYVFFQIAEGWTLSPQIIQLPARVIQGSKITSSKLQFSVTADDHKRHIFHGTIADDVIAGEFGVPDISGKMERRLDRVSASKNFVPHCK